MNKKAVLFLLIIVSSIIVGMMGWRLYSNESQDTSGQTNILPNIPVTTKTSKQTDFTASFEIYTNGTKRIFTAPMYHNQSSVVFIQDPDPSIIYVKKTGITWADFFNTLPFSLSKECLITGTGQTFCSNENQILRFFLNNTDVPDALSLEIQPGDTLRVTYGD